MIAAGESNDVRPSLARASGAEAKQPHIPGLDGLRGVAILGVIVTHVMERVPQGPGIQGAVARLGQAGWVGVDLFFVLSGFLITGILLDQRGEPGYFRTFYSRRVLRIVPAYVAFLLFSLWIAPVVGVSTHAVAAQLRATQGWYWLYLSNVYDALHGFPAEGAPSHLWSLAIEEQFYLVWPLVVAFVTPRALPKMAIGCIVAAQLFRIAFVAAGAPSDVVYVLLPTHMDALAVGAFLACAVRDPALLRKTTASRVAILATVILLVAAEALASRTVGEMLPVTELFQFPLIALTCGFLVLLVVESRTLLTNRVMRLLGRYSYAMYLWHILVLRTLVEHTRLFAANQIGGSYLPYDALLLCTGVTATLLVALVSWHLIELPFLRLKRFVPYARPSGIDRAVVPQSAIAPGASINA